MSPGGRALWSDPAAARTTTTTTTTTTTSIIISAGRIHLSKHVAPNEIDASAQASVFIYLGRMPLESSQDKVVRTMAYLCAYQIEEQE